MRPVTAAVVLLLAAVGNRKGDLAIDGRRVLQLILDKDVVRVRTGFIWLRTGSRGMK
jgi:hypothetical protein